MKKIHITLIHGTFGYQTSWIQENHFQKKLLDKLGANYDVEFFDDFSWGQKLKWKKFLDNTVYARISGANKLKKYILEKNVSNHYVIAHSHGGNIALYAMKNESVSNKIDGLICMGTPFLDHEKIDSLWPSLLISTGVMLMFSWESDSILLKLYSTTFGICVAFLYIVKYYYTKNKWEKFLDKLDLPNEAWSFLKTKILVLHTENDEAFEVLDLSSKVSNLIKRIWAKVSFWLERSFGIMIVSGIVLWVLSKIPFTYEIIEKAFDFRLIFENKLIIPFIFILSILAVVSSIIKFFHAPDYILWLLTIKLKVLHKLNWRNVDNMKVDFEIKKGLRHTSIQMNSITQISNWIKNQN